MLWLCYIPPPCLLTYTWVKRQSTPTALQGRLVEATGVVGGASSAVRSAADKIGKVRQQLPVPAHLAHSTHSAVKQQTAPASER
jgi:hypothetical protein